MTSLRADSVAVAAAPYPLFPGKSPRAVRKRRPPTPSSATPACAQASGLASSPRSMGRILPSLPWKRLPHNTPVVFSGTRRIRCRTAPIAPRICPGIRRATGFGGAVAQPTRASESAMAATSFVSMLRSGSGGRPSGTSRLLFLPQRNPLVCYLRARRSAGHRSGAFRPPS